MESNLTQTNGHKADSDEPRAVLLDRSTKDLFGPGSKLYKLKKFVASASVTGGQTNTAPFDATQGDTPTNQGLSAGIKAHMLDKTGAHELIDFNPTHSVCLDSKVGSTVGLGHRDQKIHDILDPLCRISWQDLLTAAGWDYWEGGDAFIECVHDDDDPEIIVALNHIEAAQVHIEVEEQDNAQDWHFRVTGEDGGVETVMARFGDMEDLKKRLGVEEALTVANVGQVPGQTLLNANDVRIRRRSIGQLVNSSIIHIRQPNNRSRWYGFPDYLSAVPSIELVQCMTQHEFDFFFNRGVPEFLLFIIGKSTGSKGFQKLREMLESQRGLGNSHKTCMAEFPGAPDETKIQLEKLAMEDSGQNGFADKSMALAMAIATSHGVPPILANILIPGKIGASNEGPNALLLFQKRKLGQAQRNWSVCLAQTLGSGIKLAQPDGAPVTLKREQFLDGSAKPKPNPMDPQAAMGATDENGMPIYKQPGNGFNTVLDGMTLGAQNTLASMKEPLASSDRNPADGLLSSNSDRKAGDKKKKPGK